MSVGKLNFQKPGKSEANTLKMNTFKIRNLFQKRKYNNVTGLLVTHGEPTKKEN
jgi:hypothetical protein